MCPSVLAMETDQGTPQGFGNTPRLSGRACHVGDSGWPSLGSRVGEEPVLPQGYFGDSYRRLEVSIRKPLHLQSWVYKVELIDELIISTDTNLAAAGAIQGPSIGAM